MALVSIFSILVSPLISNLYVIQHSCFPTLTLRGAGLEIILLGDVTQNEPGMTFRVICSALWEVENILSIANMNFNDFFNTVDKKGIYRGI